MDTITVDCAKDCVNGCVLGDQCPNLEYKSQAMKFVNNTSLDQMHQIAEAARLKKLTAPPKWVFPEE